MDVIAKEDCDNPRTVKFNICNLFMNRPALTPPERAEMFDANANPKRQTFFSLLKRLAS